MSLDKELIYYERLKALWEESREEIRQRINQRDKYVVQMMIGFVGVIGASRFIDVSSLWVLSPLPLFYYSLMTYHSYLIHKQLARYLSDNLEPKIKDIVRLKEFDYMEYENFFLTEKSVGVRCWIFRMIPIFVSVFIFIFLLGYSLDQYSFNHYLIILPLAILFCIAIDIARYILKECNEVSVFINGKISNVKRMSTAISVVKYVAIAISTFFILNAVEYIEIHKYFKEKGDVLFISAFVMPPIFAVWVFSMDKVEEKMKKQNIKDSPNIGVIGYGEVVKNKYLPLLTKNHEFGTVKVLDLDEEKNINETHAEACRRILSLSEDMPDIWIVATPTYTHYEYFSLLKSFGAVCAVEKPATNNLSHYKIMRARSRGLNQSYEWFPMAYYLLEKGLPMLSLLDDSLTNDKNYNGIVDFISYKDSWISIEDVRKDLGGITEFKGVILEGGNSNSLVQRAWVLSDEGGGNVWETLFHLVCMACVANSYNKSVDGTTGNLDIEKVSRYKFDLHGVQVVGDIGAYVELLPANSNDEIPWKLATAKMVDESLNKRHVELTFAGGYTSVVDFDKCNMTIYEESSKEIVAKISNKLFRKYETQMLLLKRWLESDRKMSLPMNIYDSAMVLTDKIANIQPEDISNLNGASKIDLIKYGKWDPEIFSNFDRSNV